MSYSEKLNLKWFLGVVLSLFIIFYYMIYPWVGHIEGEIDPVFVNHRTYFSTTNTTIYVGGSLQSIRGCELRSVSIINVNDGMSTILWQRVSTEVMVRYSYGTTLGYGPFQFNFDYFGYELGDVYVQTESRCHFLYDTVNTFNIN